MQRGGLLSGDVNRIFSLISSFFYMVTLVVSYLSWVDLYMGSSPGLWATSVASYGPS